MQRSSTADRGTSDWREQIAIVSHWTDASFALDTAHHVGQQRDVSDVISLKTFANSEFCPRFISDAGDMSSIGTHLPRPGGIRSWMGRVRP